MKRAAAFVIAFGLSVAPAAGQGDAGPLTINAAVEAALRDYPSAMEAAATATAAKAAVSEAKTAYLPRIDGLFQLNRASRNNVFGLLLPQSVIPSISGPVLGTDSFESAWGSAAGLLFSVEVFDFGRRAASLHVAESQQAVSEAQADLARLSAGVAAADAYLSALGAQQTVIAAQANVSRLEVLGRAIKAQVDAELKPGADQSRIDAELAAARNRAIAAEQSLALARLQLAAAMGQPAADLTLQPGRLLDMKPGPATAATPPAGHPAVRAAEAASRAAEARQDVTERQFRPKIFLSGALAARASGANVDGTIDNGHGLWPDVPNWAAGMTVTFPFADFAANRARARIESAESAAAAARASGARQQSQTEFARARIMIDAATKTAANIPAQLSAARQADVQARARYDAGLTGVTEVADAQRLLAQAETEEALASLALWRARLAEAAASGDLAGFLAEAANPSGPRVKP